MVMRGSCDQAKERMRIRGLLRWQFLGIIANKSHCDVISKTIANRHARRLYIHSRSYSITVRLQKREEFTQNRAQSLTEVRYETMREQPKVFPINSRGVPKVIPSMSMTMAGSYVTFNFEHELKHFTHFHMNSFFPSSSTSTSSEL